METFAEFINEFLWSLATSLWQLIQWVLGIARALDKFLVVLIPILWKSVCWIFLVFIPFIFEPIVFLEKNTNFIVAFTLSIVYIVTLFCLSFLCLLAICVPILLIFNPQYRKGNTASESNFQTSRATQEEIEIAGLQAKQPDFLRSPISLQDQRCQPYSIELLDKMAGWEFELALAEIYRELNYEVKMTLQTRDYGADFILTKGTEQIVVQAKKRSDQNVNLKAVQEVVSAIGYYKNPEALITRGIVITNRKFANNAIVLANANGIELIDRNELRKLVERANQAAQESS